MLSAASDTMRDETSSYVVSGFSRTEHLTSCRGRGRSRGGPELSALLRDTSHGECHLLLAIAVTIERLPAFAKVVEPCTGQITF
jgi:hypothetical protein